MFAFMLSVHMVGVESAEDVFLKAETRNQKYESGDPVLILDTDDCAAAYSALNPDKTGKTPTFKNGTFDDGWTLPLGCTLVYDTSGPYYDDNTPTYNLFIMPERDNDNWRCTSAKACIIKNECPPGKYGDYDHENCQSCPAGRYLNESGKVASTPAEACKECELGKIAEKEGQVGCDIVFLFVSEVRELFGKDDPKVITKSADCEAAYATLHPYGKATSAVSGSGKPTGCSTDWNAGNLYIESDTQESNWCGKDNHMVSYDEIKSCILKNECPPGKYGDYDHVKCQACPLCRSRF